MFSKLFCWRTAGKAAAWRVTASTETMVLGYLVTGSWKAGAGIASIEIVSKFGLYYVFEKTWIAAKEWFAGKAAAPAAA
jgi:uncharacterized membrane protein